MPAAEIAGIWAAEPTNPWVPVSTFRHSDPEFGIVLHIKCDPALVAGSGAYPVNEFVGFDLLVQFVNRAEDPVAGREWWRWDGGFRATPTVDYVIRDLTFPSTDFGLIVTWPGGRYQHAMQGVGNGVSPGVYALRASLQGVRRLGLLGYIEIDTFAATDDEAFTYQIQPY
jgi:hypothetical protein